jgi:8-oxo-dGTP pyrophosphatase MutT (NUDIX family)
MEKITHQGKIIEVVQKEVDQDGKTTTFEFARRSPGTRLVIPKGDKVILTREFRHEIGGYDHRLPGGKVFNSLEEYNAALSSGADITEAAKQAAIREAHEEAGIEVKDVSFLHKSVCGATVVWDLFYFLVKDFVKTAQHLEEGEDIRIEPVDREKAREMCLNGEINEERSALILLRYLDGRFQ